MRKWFSGFGVALTLTAVLSIPFAFASPDLLRGGYDRIPEPDPPAIERDVPEAPSSATALRWMAPSALTEWTYHKTGDNLHPDGNEQQMVWLMNRARSDPAQEGAWLATEDDPDIAAARTYWGVNVTVLQNEFAAIPAKPPVAFDVRLYDAAKAHSDYLISIDGQTHTGQFDRILTAGFEYTSAAGIVYSYSDHAHNPGHTHDNGSLEQCALGSKIRGKQHRARGQHRLSHLRQRQLGGLARQRQSQRSGHHLLF